MENEITRELLMIRIAELIGAYESTMNYTVGCEVMIIDPDVPITADYNNEITYSYNGQSFVKCIKE